MNMKHVFEAALNGTFDLSDMLGKINTHHISGNLTDAEREELIREAREKADPMGGVDIKAMLMEHEARLQALEKSNQAIPDNTPGTDNVEDYRIGTWYKAGDLMRYEGTVYRCVAPNGYIRAWSPADHPDCWEAVSV